MEHNTPLGATISLFITFIMGFFGWINWTSMQEWLKVASLLVSMAAGIMAIRYYYYATKKNKLP